MLRSPTHSDGLFPNESVSVFNAERLKTPTGKAKVIHGYAYRPDPKEEGRLTVKLQGAPLAPCKLTHYTLCTVCFHMVCANIMCSNVSLMLDAGMVAVSHR